MNKKQRNIINASIKSKGMLVEDIDAYLLEAAKQRISKYKSK